MTRFERIANRRYRAWVRWQVLCHVAPLVARTAWVWVMGWDALYHETARTGGF